MGLNISHVNAASAASLQVNFLWEDSPAGELTIHLRRKLPDQDGYLIVETITTNQASHIFDGLDSGYDIREYDVVVEDVANYKITYQRSDDVIDVLLDKVYDGQLTFPGGQVEFTANGFPVATDYPNFGLC